MSEHVTLTRSNGIAEIAIRRGDQLNALSLAVLHGLKRAADALRSDTSVHAVILTGDPVFTAGADLKDPALASRAKLTLLERRETLRAGPDACDALAALDQFTIVAIEGFCIGGGVALAAACDTRLAAAGSYFRLPEVPLGMNMSWHAIPRLVALMGPARAKRFTLLGEKLSAEAALAQGLADEIHPDGAVLAAARNLAARAAALPPIALRMAKRAISAASDALHSATSYADLDQFALASSSGDYAEAVTAFLERRPPRFTGA